MFGLPLGAEIRLGRLLWVPRSQVGDVGRPGHLHAGTGRQRTVGGPVDPRPTIAASTRPPFGELRISTGVMTTKNGGRMSSGTAGPGSCLVALHALTARENVEEPRPAVPRILRLELEFPRTSEAGLFQRAPGWPVVP